MLKNMLHIELKRDDDWVIRTHVGYFIFPRGSKISYEETLINDYYDEWEEGYDHTFMTHLSHESSYSTFNIISLWGNEDAVAKLQEGGYKHVPFLHKSHRDSKNLWVLVTYDGYAVNGKRSWLCYSTSTLISQWGSRCWNVDQATQVANIYIANR